MKEDLKWEINKIQFKNISRHRTQNVNLCSMPSQLDHGKHLVRRTLFLYMHRCQSEGWIILKDRTKWLNKTMSCKNKIAHFQWMRHLPRHQPHGTKGPNKGGNVRLIDVRLKARVLFPETNNQAAWRALAKWLKNSRKPSNETVH